PPPPYPTLFRSYELRCRDLADAGRVPARERLGADDRAGADVDLRLEMRGEARRARFAEQADELHVGGELERLLPLDPGLPRDRRMPEGRLRAPNHLARVAAVAARDDARVNARPRHGARRQRIVHRRHLAAKLRLDLVLVAEREKYVSAGHAARVETERHEPLGEPTGHADRNVVPQRADGLIELRELQRHEALLLGTDAGLSEQLVDALDESVQARQLRVDVVIAHPAGTILRRASALGLAGQPLVAHGDRAPQP